MSEKENICEDAMIAVSKMASGVSCQGASHFLLISTFNFHIVFVHFQHVILYTIGLVLIVRIGIGIGRTMVYGDPQVGQSLMGTLFTHQ